MEYILLTILILMLVVLVDICIHVRKLSAREIMQVSNLREHEKSTGECGYAIWASRKGTWHLDSNRCGSGFVPGGPPRRSAAYEGEVVKKPGVPVS